MWKGAWHGPSTRFVGFRRNTTPAGTSASAEGVNGTATPSSNILNFFFPPKDSLSFSPRARLHSNDARLSIEKGRYGVAAAVCRYAIFYFLYGNACWGDWIEIPSEFSTRVSELAHGIAMHGTDAYACQYKRARVFYVK